MLCIFCALGCSGHVEKKKKFFLVFQGTLNYLKANSTCTCNVIMLLNLSCVNAECTSLKTFIAGKKLHIKHETNLSM